MTEVTLEAVSPFGIKYGGSDKWTNVNKGLELDLKSKFHPGDVVNIELNKGGYLMEVSLVTAAPAKAAKPAWKGGSFKSEDPDRSAKMSRGAAVKAVLQSPFVADEIKDMSKEAAIAYIFEFSDKIASYVEKGA